MRHDWDLGGVYFAPFAGEAALALIILLVARMGFARLRFGDHAANAPLAEAGIYVCILTVLVLIL
jgi:hypothetical protein